MTAEDPRPAEPAFPHVRVSLEPGYGGSLVGGWVLDVPGVFGAAPTREAALTAALGSAARVRAWLEERGEPFALRPFGRPEAVVEVPATHEPDGYEVNATFDDDRRPATAEDVERTARWIGWQRADLLATAERVDAHERAHGPLQTDVVAGERTAAAVLRHLAGSEVWLVGRLDPALRYPGGVDDVPAVEALAGTRAWVLERVHERAAGDDGVERPDRHGETWTLRKVLRRLVYHGFDHLWELDRRLARADGTRERIAIRTGDMPDGPTLAALLRTVGWDVRASDPASLERAARASSVLATAWDGGRLVGTARLVEDETLNGLVAMVVAHPSFQGLGVGERLVRRVMEGKDHLRIVLAAAPGTDGWYRKLGFEPDPQAMVRPRRRHRA